MQRVAPFLLLGLLCLAFFLPGIAVIPPIDRDESRYAQASKQMIESGDYLRIRFQEESRAKKPAGIYWLQVASARLTAHENAIWPYRLPSLIGATIAVLLCFGLMQGLIGRNAAGLAAGLLACSFLLVSEAHQAKTDAMLLATIILAQGLMARLYCQRERDFSFALAMLFWLAQAGAILIKGPILPILSLFAFLTLSGLERNMAWAKRLRPLPGLMLVVLIVGPWAFAISRATAGQFIGQAVKNDLLPKLLGAQESHGAAFGSYALMLAATFWPGSLFLLPAAAQAWRSRKQAVTKFLLAWLIPGWLMFELVPTKLPNYVLPLFPALALLTGLWLADSNRPSLSRIARLFGWIWAAIGALLAVAMVAAPLAFGAEPLWILMPIAAVLLLLSITGGFLMWFQQPRRAALMAVSSAFIAYCTIFQIGVPQIEPLWLSQRIAALIPKDVPLAATGFNEPSLIFLTGTATKIGDGGMTADFLAAHENGWAVVEKESEPAFQKGLAEQSVTVEKIAELDGFNYSRGRSAHVTIYRRR